MDEAQIILLALNFLLRLAIFVNALVKARSNKKDK